jgi:hypothetical protein
MKPQQRNFIVEVKSGRRRSAVRPASIWGDTDLKALVRPIAQRRISSQLSSSLRRGRAPEAAIKSGAQSVELYRSPDLQPWQKRLLSCRLTPKRLRARS